MGIEPANQNPLLAVTTLGRFEVLQDGRRVEGITLRKGWALLIFLLLNPGLHDRSRLSGLLWGDCSEKRALHNLRQTLWHLRRSLPAGLLAEDRLQVGIAQTGRVQVDAWDFEAETRQAGRERGHGDEVKAIAHLRKAMALYQGEFLADLDVAGCPEFATWRAGYVAHLHEMALTAATRLTAHFLRRGEYEQALRYARRQLQMEPWWEEGHRLVMTLLALTGQRSAALAQYETCRRLLAEEVGVEPIPETTALYQRLLHWQAEDWVARPPAAQALPLPFSGRGEEHARLVAWWERSRQERGHLTLIAGEAGAGKTRLVEEMIRYAEMQGAVAISGRCYEFGESVPYQAIAEALRHHLLRPDFRLPAFSNAWLAELARLVPDLRDLQPELPAASRVAGVAARQRLFEAVARFLRALSASGPAGATTSLLFFLDDLHWADASTLDLLHYLVRQLHDAPICFVGAYRPEETEPGHRLTRLRQGLSRDHLVEHLALAPLSAAAVAEIAGALVDAEAAQALAAFLYDESEGNPLFLVETVSDLQERGALRADREGHWHWLGPLSQSVLPTTVQDVILQRVARLSPPARQMLTLAAVIGRHFDAALLRRIARRDAAAVSASLQEWLARHLVRGQPGAPGCYDFNHDKIRAVVYEATDAGRRHVLHRQVARALEQDEGREKPVGQLAYHWSQAGEMEKAVPYLLKAGDQARLLYAEGEAVAYYRQALAYFEETRADEQAARTLMRLGLTYHTAFDLKQARQAYDQAFLLWQQAENRPQQPAPHPAPRPLRVRWLEPTALDPALAPDAHTDCLLAHLFSGLVELRPAMNIVPDVARSWEMTSEGRSFIFHLRGDVYWSDGVRVTARDFEFAWKRVLDPATNSPAAFFLYDLKGGRRFHHGQGSREAVGVRALDDITLRVELETPVGYFPQLLTHATWYPVPRHIVEKCGPAWAREAPLVSNGAFLLQDWRRGEKMTLTRNPAYHGRFSGNLQRVILLPVQDWETRLRWYEADDLDILGVTFLAPARREDMRQRHVDEYIARPRLETHFLAFDVTRPPFDDVQVRRAFVLATDRTTLADQILQGYVTPAAGGLLPPGMPGHAADIALPYDPDAARRLLAQAGFPGGRGFPAIETLVFAAVDERNRFLQRQWRDILGIEMRLEVVEWSEFLTQLGRRPYHLLNLGWLADYPDPDNFLRVSRARSWPLWRHDVYERLIAEGRGLTDSGERLQRYRQAEEILVQEAPILPLVYERDHLLINPRLRRYPMSAIRPAFWKDAALA